MKTTYPCKSCKKACRKNQNCVCCDICNQWLHKRCTPLTIFQFQALCKQNSEPYFCNHCYKDIFPFQNVTVLETNQGVQSTHSEDTNPLSNDIINNPYLSDISPYIPETKYHEILDLKNILLHKSPNDISIIHMNAVSLGKKLETIEELVHELTVSPDIICISETKLKDEKMDFQMPFVQIPNYSLEIDNSPTNAGGTAMYINNDIEYKLRKDLNFGVTKCEMNFIEIMNVNSNVTDKDKKHKKQDKPIIGVIYRHPKNDLEAFLESFQEKLDPIVSKSKPIHLFGDININDDPELRNYQVDSYRNFLMSFGCVNLINKPTRHESKTVLDHIVTSVEVDKIKAGILRFHISDHLPTFAIVNVSKKVTKKSENKIYKRLFDPNKKDIFLEDLKKKIESNRNINTENPNSRFDAFIKIIESAIDHHFPLRKLSKRQQKHYNKPWITKEIQKEIKEKHKMFSEYTKAPTAKKYEEFKKFRNNLDRKLKKAERTYTQTNLEKNSNNTKKTWKILNNTLKRSKKKTHITPDIIGVNGWDTSDHDSSTVRSSPKFIANKLNTFFSNIGNEITKNLPEAKKSFKVFLGRKNKKAFRLFQIENEEIIKHIQDLKDEKAIGYDGVHPKILKWGANLISPILTSIYNDCISKGIYLDKLKIAKVFPAYKSGSKNDLGNYRPISILSQFNKIFEKALHLRLMNFLEKYRILSRKQFGFQKQHSTQHAIVDLKECLLKNAENGLISGALFLDMRKAFDSVKHDILINKLEHYGIRGTALKLFKSYLTNRKQYTTVKGTNSDKDTVSSGVPQGSVLGPLFFLLYINDLPKATNLKTWLFADDAVLVAEANNLKTLENFMNAETEMLNEWLISNQLAIHYVKKTTYMLINFKKKQNSKNFKLYIGENLISQTDEYKYLGVVLDNKLNWKNQINKLTKSVAGTTGALYKVRYKLTKKSMKTIYHTLVGSKLNYAALSWGTAGKSILKKLEVAQNNFIRCINFSDIRTNLKQLYSSNQILPVSELVKIEAAKFIHKSKQGKAPGVFDNYFLTPGHTYETTAKSNQNIKVKLCRTKRGKQSLQYFGSKCWNKINVDFKNISSTKTFSTTLRNTFFKL